MAKNISAVVSGAGFAAAFWVALDKAARRRGLDEEAIYNGLKEDSPLIERFAELIAETTNKFLANKFLKFVREVSVNGIKKFVARDAFGENNADGIKFYLWPNFQNSFLGKTEEEIKPTTIAIHRLEKPSRDDRIMAELGINIETKKGVIKLAHFREMLKAQAQGQEGPLLVNGYANVAYIEDEKGEVWAVYADWHSDDREWSVGARSVEGPGGWEGGCQVLSQVS